MTTLRASFLVAAALATGTSQPVAQANLRLSYLGAAGWEITDGSVVVLVDPYLRPCHRRRE